MKNVIILFFTITLLFSCNNEPQHLVKIEGKQLPVTENIYSNKTIEAIIIPYKEKVLKEMNTLLSFSPNNLVRTDGELESSLGNLIADLCFQRANPVFEARTGKNIDFAMFNYGGIRAGITKGEIKNQHAFNIMPFENSLVVVELNSSKIEELVQFLITEKKAHPLSKQFNLFIKKDGFDLKINNTPIDKTKTYFVLTTDFLQNGGDHMNFFKNPIELYVLDYKMRNAIIDYFKEIDTVKVTLDGRFRIAK
jgi:5'-nucleotidase